MGSITSLRCQHISNSCAAAGIGSLVSQLSFAAWLTLFIFEKSSLNGNRRSGWLQRGLLIELPGINEVSHQKTWSCEQFEEPTAVLPWIFVRCTDPTDASAVYSDKYFSLLSLLASEKTIKCLKKNLSNFSAVTERENQRIYFCKRTGI